MPKTIAVAGCISHIGATTQAIQAVQVIKENGLKACYIEMNRTGYLDNVLALYAQAEDRKSFIRFSGIDMYKKNYAKSVVKQSWDYVIRDYGPANVGSFEEASYAEQPLKIVVCGSKPNEIFKTQDLLRDPIYDDAFFIFSFVPEEERVDLLSLMGDRSEKTFFSGIILDPYGVTPDSKKIFQKILGGTS